MLITAVKRIKAGIFAVFADGDFCVLLHSDIYYGQSLDIGTELTQDRLTELKAKSDELLAREKSMRLLSARAYTGKQLYDKLRVNFDEHIAESAVERMTELGLIDDADYAARRAQMLISEKGYSAYRAVMELCRIGIDREIAQTAADALESDEVSRIKQLIERKYSGLQDTEKGRRKMIGSLVRLGYSYDDIRHALGEFS